MAIEKETIMNKALALTLTYVLTEASNDELVEAYRKALGIRMKVLGPGHPDTARSFNALANVLLEQGKEQQLTPSEQRARARCATASLE